VTGGGQVTAEPTRTAAGVEDVRTARHHRIHQAGLAIQITPSGRHGPEAVDIPLRVPWVGGNLLHPDTLLDHRTIVAGRSG
jgi:hypothetical protein